MHAIAVAAGDTSRLPFVIGADATTTMSGQAHVDEPLVITPAQLTAELRELAARCQQAASLTEALELIGTRFLTLAGKQPGSVSPTFEYTHPSEDGVRQYPAPNQLRLPDGV